MINKVAYIIITIGALVGASFELDAQTITGKFASKKSPHSIQLNADSTFVYEYGAFHKFKYSTGIWRKNGKNEIVLNSQYQSLIPRLKIDETKLSDEQKISELDFMIKVIGEFELADYKCAIVINDTIYDSIKDGYLISSMIDSKTADHELNLQNFWGKYIRCDSLSLLKVNTLITKIYFKFVLNPRVINSTYFSNTILKTNSFFPKDGFENLKVESILTDSLFYYTIFSNERLKIKRNRIEFFIPNLKKWQSLARVPNSEIIFFRH